MAGLTAVLSYPCQKNGVFTQSESKKVICMHIKEKIITPSIMKEVYTKKSNKIGELEKQNKTNREFG